LGLLLGHDTSSPPVSQSDVYSYGIVLWELLTWQSPYILLAQEDLPLVPAGGFPNDWMTRCCIHTITPPPPGGCVPE
jgi:serine/threonine protein kinase